MIKKPKMLYIIGSLNYPRRVFKSLYICGIDPYETVRQEVIYINARFKW